MSYYVHSRFQQSRNQLHKEQNNETQKHDELYKNNGTQQTRSSKTNWVRYL